MEKVDTQGSMDKMKQPIDDMQLSRSRKRVAFPIMKCSIIGECTNHP